MSLIGVLGAEETAAEGDEVEEDRETLHRLCPTYAQDINSPLRHVRTRIYFTSESHMHSLINVLRYSHLCEPSIPPCLACSHSSVPLLTCPCLPAHHTIAALSSAAVTCISVCPLLVTIH